LLISLTGCGDGRPLRVPVAGVITLDDKPFTAGGNIVFQPKEGRPSASKIDNEGRFRLGTFEGGDGCPLGDYTVTVHSMDKIGSTKRRWNLPKKYHQIATTDLKQTIVGPTEKLVINLSWGGGPQGPLIEEVDVVEAP
jgi:hypothetical protein